jgi:hypothetical protein
MLSAWSTALAAQQQAVKKFHVVGVFKKMSHLQ